MRNSIWLIPIALLCAVLLISVEIQQAYAEATFTVITPTGGGFVPTTADCTDISAGNDIVWLNCSDSQKLFAISDTSNAVLANITTSGALNQVLACLSDTSCVYLNDPTANTVTKYLYSGGLITQTAIWSAPCNTDALGFSYDPSGFIWNTCSATDQIVRLNPSTMATDTLASTGATCVAPDFVSYTNVDNIGVVHCTNNAGADTIISFSRTSSTAISVLDTETTTSGTINVMIDGAHNTILAPSGTVMSVWTYTAGGLLTLSQTITGNVYDKCMIEPYLVSSPSQLLYALCESYSAPNTRIFAFMINSTAVFQVLNGAVTYSDANAIGLDVHDGSESLPVWYISSSTNNGKYIRIDGVRSLTDTAPPTTPPPDDDDDVGGVDCSDPANEQILTCRIDGGGAIGGGGAFIIGNTTGGIGLVPIFCNVGIVDCEENPDMKTNGAGLLFTIIALMVSVGILWVASRGDLGSIPMFIWMLDVLAIFGFATLANLIDPTILLVAIVAIVALATVKLRGLFGGDFK